MCICAPPTTPLEGVTVYGRQDASDFQAIRAFLEARGVLFEHVDSADDAARQQVAAISGQHEASVVQIGSKIFVGFKPDALTQALP